MCNFVHFEYFLSELVRLKSNGCQISEENKNHSAHLSENGQTSKMSKIQKCPWMAIVMHSFLMILPVFFLSLMLLP